MASLGYHPSLIRNKSGKNSKSNRYNFLNVLSKFYKANFKTISATLAASGACQVTNIAGAIDKNSRGYANNF